jgi:Pep3/Vps18/deep orange family
VRKTYWAYTDQSLYELRVGNEDRDVWKINLQKEIFDVALKYAKVRHHQNIAFLVLTFSGNRLQDRETSSSLRKHRHYSRLSGTSRQLKPSLNAQYHSRTSH